VLEVPDHFAYRDERLVKILKLLVEQVLGWNASEEAK